MLFICNTHALKPLGFKDVEKKMSQLTYQNLPPQNCSNVFVGQSPKAIEIRAKNKQMGPNQTYKLFYSKRNHKQNEKTIYELENNSKQ